MACAHRASELEQRILFVAGSDGCAFAGGTQNSLSFKPLLIALNTLFPTEQSLYHTHMQVLDCRMLSSGPRRLYSSVPPIVSKKMKMRPRARTPQRPILHPTENCRCPELPVELWSIILSFSEQHTVTAFLSICHKLRRVALPRLLKIVDLDRHSAHTISFCEYVLSPFASQNLSLVRQIIIRMRTFQTRRSLRAQDFGRAALPRISTPALCLLDRALKKLAASGTSLSIRLDDPPEELLSLSTFKEDSLVLERVISASFFLPFLCQTRFRHISHLCLSVLTESFAHELASDMAFPSLAFLAGPLEVVDAFSLQHFSIAFVSVQEYAMHRGQPIWIKSVRQIKKLFAALRRVSLRHLAVALSLAGDSKEAHLFFDQLGEGCPGLESLAVTMRGPATASEENRYLVSLENADLRRTLLTDPVIYPAHYIDRGLCTRELGTSRQPATRLGLRDRQIHELGSMVPQDCSNPFFRDIGWSRAPARHA